MSKIVPGALGTDMFRRFEFDGLGYCVGGVIDQLRLWL